MLCSARAGGDQWDNPRYRVLFLPFIAIVTAWGWQWSRRNATPGFGPGWVPILFLSPFFLAGISAATAAWPNCHSGDGSWILAGSALLLAAGWIVGHAAPGQIHPRRAAGFAPITAGLFQLKPAAGQPARAPLRLRVNRWDSLIILFFLAFATLYFLGRLQSNYPVLILSGDAGNITSFAAAQARPELFRGDPVLGRTT